MSCREQQGEYPDIAALSTYNLEVSAARQQRENRPVGADSAQEQLVCRNNGTQDAMRLFRGGFSRGSASQLCARPSGLNGARLPQAGQPEGQTPVWVPGRQEASPPAPQGSITAIPQEAQEGFPANQIS